MVGIADWLFNMDKTLQIIVGFSLILVGLGLIYWRDNVFLFFGAKKDSLAYKDSWFKAGNWYVS